MKSKLVVASVIGLFVCSVINSQTLDENYGKDVQSIATIIDAYYDVVSGSSEDPWQFERDSYIHSKNAIITRLDENGNAESHALEAEYIPLALAPKEDFYEKELKRTVSQFGNIAQVWSAFEIRTDPEIATIVRGLNSIQLRYENERWFIDSWTCEMEHSKNPLVAQFLMEQ
jgi:fructose-1,6-bisphosphatase